MNPTRSRATARAPRWRSTARWSARAHGSGAMCARVCVVDDTGATLLPPTSPHRPRHRPSHPAHRRHARPSRARPPSTRFARASPSSTTDEPSSSATTSRTTWSASASTIPRTVAATPRDTRFERHANTVQASNARHECSGVIKPRAPPTIRGKTRWRRCVCTSARGNCAARITRTAWRRRRAGGRDPKKDRQTTPTPGIDGFDVGAATRDGRDARVPPRRGERRSTRRRKRRRGRVPRRRRCATRRTPRGEVRERRDRRGAGTKHASLFCTKVQSTRVIL